MGMGNTVYSLLAVSIAGSILSIQAYCFSLVGILLGWILYVSAGVVSFLAGYFIVRRTHLA